MIDTCIFSENRVDKNWVEGYGGLYFLCCFVFQGTNTHPQYRTCLFFPSWSWRWRLPAYERWKDTEWLWWAERWRV